MKMGMLVFIAGLLFFMLGIYLSTYIVSVGTLLGVGGGMMLGVGSYFIGTNQANRTRGE
jgi:positive regulator of sigma E activity